MKKTIRQLMSLVEAKEHRIVLSLIFLVILGGILYSFYIGDNLQFSDEVQYYTIAKNITLKHMYTLDGIKPTAMLPPGYPLLLSFFISLGASITHLRILNFVALGLSIYLLYLIVKNLSSQFAGLIAVVLVICYPALFYLAGKLFAQTIGTFLFLLILFILSRTKTFSIKPFLLIGFLLGCLILTVPSFIFPMFVIVLWVLFSTYEGRIKASVAIFFVAFFVISIWSARNYNVFNSFVFLSTNSGTVLLLGNSEDTTPDTPGRMDFSKYTEDIAGLNLNEVEKDRHLRSKAIEYILENKMRTIKLYFLKVLNYFNFRNKLSSDSDVETFAKNYKDIIMLLTYGPLILLFLLRMLSFKRFTLSRFELLLIILYLSNAFFLAIFITRIRFRLPFDFMLIAIVAMFIYNYIRSQA